MENKTKQNKTQYSMFSIYRQVTVNTKYKTKMASLCMFQFSLESKYKNNQKQKDKAMNMETV